ncbi:sigma-70 family RNA polymerase sigma factor [Polyangium sp. 15x6]|uniref:RNA polymerase sigma factor n=1 Tax=Polyangium sp. 15x6 TaxID=3042687 RepID=UPI00249AC47F|nr:sigma-70 family RNA polymerase sigma factor [Polyangium sp. 15x6]MDI3291880.1 sigma-70 family RNA polymerase sigma factor [Polyangium sp. 15x6]
MTDEELEQRVLGLLAEGKPREAAELAVYGEPKDARRGGHGERISGYLRGLARNEADADDAFGDFAIDVVKGIRTFQGKSSLRAWLYTVARNAFLASQRRGGRRREEPLGEGDEASKIRQEARKSTTSWRKTDKRDALVELRRELDEEDQTILILRADRGFSWKDAARVMLGETDVVDEEALKREANRVKKRYERVIDELREKAITKGLWKREG